jgi:hypothetical protein
MDAHIEHDLQEPSAAKALRHSAIRRYGQTAQTGMLGPPNDAASLFQWNCGAGFADGSEMVGISRIEIRAIAKSLQEYQRLGLETDSSQKADSWPQQNRISIQSLRR